MMKKNNNIELSVIIPIYNAEDYLSICIDSLMFQDDLRLEIILINDGSTDSSGEIANHYAKRDSRIKVIHQKNAGASAARNTGLNLAQGEYIAFVDNDDWVKENSFHELYREALKYQADVIMGNVWFYNEDGTMYRRYNPAPVNIQNTILPGSDCFIRLLKKNAYPPMQYNYIYRRRYLEKIQVRFEEGLTAEDELWTPIVLCQAERMVIVDIDFYYYRQREGSVTRSTDLKKRLDTVFRVIDGLFEFADRFDFSGETAELKSWLYAHIFRLYWVAFQLVVLIRDSSVVLPEFQLDRFWRDCLNMKSDAYRVCKSYYWKSETLLRNYIDWRTSEWVAPVASHINIGKKLMLIYNAIQGEGLSLKEEDVPSDWVITTDRKYFQKADAVVFYLPDLYQELEVDLDKPEDQLWVSWYLESEKDHPAINDPEIRDVFDIWISCPKNEDQKEHLVIYLCRAIDEKIIR